MLPTLLAEETTGWHYAAWVSVDLRLLVFLVLISTLTSAGITVLLVKRRRFWDYASVFIVCFTVMLALCVLVFNEIAQYPVFVVESFFRFP